MSTGSNFLIATDVELRFQVQFDIHLLMSVKNSLSVLDFLFSMAPLNVVAIPPALNLQSVTHWEDSVTVNRMLWDVVVTNAPLARMALDLKDVYVC